MVRPPACPPVSSSSAGAGLVGCAQSTHSSGPAGSLFLFGGMKLLMGKTVPQSKCERHEWQAGPSVRVRCKVCGIIVAAFQLHQRGITKVYLATVSDGRVVALKRIEEG